jgi:hypothetical protein
MIGRLEGVRKFRKSWIDGREGYGADNQPRLIKT